jgi:hypothetical protein
MVSSGTVNKLDAVRIGINGVVLKYRNLDQIRGIAIKDLVEYEGDKEGIWLNSIRKISHIPMVPDHPTSHNGEIDSMTSYEARIAPPGKGAQSEDNNGSLPAVPSKADINTPHPMKALSGL